MAEAHELTSVLGVLQPSSEVEFPSGDVGWMRGYGVYETLCVYPGGIFRVPAHVARLRQSADLLRLPLPDPVAIQAALKQWLDATKVRWGTARIVVLPDSGRSWWMIEGRAQEGPRPVLEERALSMWFSGLCVPPPPLGAAKTISRVSYELAAIQAQAEGYDDAIMPTAHGDLGESTRASVFWRQVDTVYTPPLCLGILPGVTRSLVVEHLPSAGYPVEEKTVPMEALREADEVWVTSTVRGVAPVVQLGDASGAVTHLEIGPAAAQAEATLMTLVGADGLLE